MDIEVLKSKILRAVITEANLNYVGSLTLDEDLMDAANIIENEKVQVVNVNNGNRLETYVIKGKRGSGVVCLNGPAAPVPPGYAAGRGYEPPSFAQRHPFVTGILGGIAGSWR